MTAMIYPDRYKMTSKQATYFAHKNLVQLIYDNSRFEGTQTTLPQTQTIVDGMSVAGVSTDDVVTIASLKRAWQMVIANTQPYTVKISNKINAQVAVADSLDPGNFRTGTVCISGTDYIPPILSSTEITTIIQQILSSTNTDAESMTDKLLKLLLVMMRGQFYWNGNKRTAFLTVNYLAINAGIGLFNISEEQLPTFNTLLSHFYTTNDSQKLMDWLYQNCIYGLQL